MSKKKKVLFTIIGLFSFLLIAFLTFYFYSMSPINKNKGDQYFIVSPGTSKLQIVKELKEDNLIRNELALDIYLFFNSDLTLQAGTYVLNDTLSPKEMIRKMSKGEVKNETFRVTLVEGKRLDSFMTSLSEKLEVTKEELIACVQDKEYLKKLIDKYWFLDESILNSSLKYPLEGYLFPETYEFYEHSTPETIIEKILDNTELQLEKLKDTIDKSGFSVHDILSMAAIIELEAVNESDRNTVSQVIRKRLEMGKCLGMDVTTYYAVGKSLGDGLTLSDLKTVSPFNTSEMNSSMAGKLPVGPICNPSLMSITAALNPSDTDYLYFYADVKTGKVYFSKTYEEHVQVQREVG